MDERFDEIAAFADIGEFIDQPVRTYSSGMFVRLAFAAAVHVAPDILVVDEALAVGDAGFRARCFRRIGELRGSGCTILLVSHDMEQVATLCHRVLLLDEGRPLQNGHPEAAIAQYQRLLEIQPDTCEAVQEPTFFLANRIGGGHDAVAYEPDGAVIENVRLRDFSGRNIPLLHKGQVLRCLFEVQFTRAARHVRCAMLIKTRDGVRLGGAWTAPSAESGVDEVAAGTRAETEFEFVCALSPGTCVLSVAVFGSKAGVEYALHGLQGALRFQVETNIEDATIGAVDFGCRSSIRLSAGSEI